MVKVDRYFYYLYYHICFVQKWPPVFNCNCLVFTSWLNSKPANNLYHNIIFLFLDVIYSPPWQQVSMVLTPWTSGFIFISLVITVRYSVTFQTLRNTFTRVYTLPVTGTTNWKSNIKPLSPCVWTYTSVRPTSNTRSDKHVLEPTVLTFIMLCVGCVLTMLTLLYRYSLFSLGTTLYIYTSALPFG